MMGVAWVVLLGAVALLGLAWLRRRKAGLPVLGEDERASSALVVAFGMVIPAIALVVLFIVANFSVASGTRAPRRGATALDGGGGRAPVVVGGPLPRHHGGHGQRDPHPRGHARRRAGPPRRRHPQLLGAPAQPQDRHGARPHEPRPARGRPPGHLSRAVRGAVRAAARAHGDVGRGPAAAGVRRLAARDERAAAPAGHAARPTRGSRSSSPRAAPTATPCAGPPPGAASGRTSRTWHSRETLAAVTIPNDPADLASWIRDPQHIKPGNRMPDLGLRGADLRAVVAYLEALR
jgi:hypothetical protein